jgi:hypothetical protein
MINPPVKNPLHGTKTHPLTEKALEVLRRIEKSPLPRQEINPGVVNRLEREVLVQDIMLPSPYKTHKKQPIVHLSITEAGKLKLNESTS